MPNVMNDFSFDGMESPQLIARYEQLRAIALAKGDDATTEILSEMVAICQVLRRKSSRPPKTPRLKANPTIRDL
jgi:ribosomal 50S subunit-associated protein YjgA (DUF615 family)